METLEILLNPKKSQLLVEKLANLSRSRHKELLFVLQERFQVLRLAFTAFPLNTREVFHEAFTLFIPSFVANLLLGKGLNFILNALTEARIFQLGRSKLQRCLLFWLDLVIDGWQVDSFL